MDSICGGVYGLLAGDKNHGPSAMSLIVLKTIFETNQKNLKDGLKSLKFEKTAIFGNYLAWYHRKGTGWWDTGEIGRTVFGGFDLKTFGSENKNEIPKKIDFAVDQIDKSKRGFTAGVNPAHRNGVLGLFQGKFNVEGKEKSLFEIIKSETLLTHKNSLATETAFVVAHIVRCWALDNTTGIEKILQSLLKNSEVPLSKKTKTSVMIGMLNGKNLQMAYSNVKKSGFSPHTLRNCLYFLKRFCTEHDELKTWKKKKEGSSKKLFCKWMEKCFDFAGSANYEPVLLGLLMGTKVGMSNISKKMLSHCKESNLKNAKLVCSQFEKCFKK